MELPDWTRGMVLLGEDEDGELQIVGLDAAGRISAFVIDSRDAWNRMISVGNAELAVRLGSAVAYDRRGQVVFLEDFEHGYSLWTWAKSGNLAACALDPTSSLSGGYSVKLTGGNHNVRFSLIGMTRGVAPMGRVGLEFSIAFGSGVNYVSGSLSMHDGTDAYRAQIRYEWVGMDVDVYDDGGDWTWVAGVANPGVVGNEYNTFKFVIDQATRKYVRALFNDIEVHPTTTSYYRTGPTNSTHITVQIAVYSRDGNNDVVYVDNVVVTLAEPAN